ncbi:MAG: nucleotidyl transferase AbiEii/AbiGii toxin family protein [Pirellulaceae bacterium]|nr:nucleotidyl transferase AbiEii/AbiGii toxin family protein [Pirellulaceae bacterium]
MRQIEQVTREVVTWLMANRYGYALIGGLAVSFRTIERFTKDIDLVIAVENDQQAESCVRELAGLGYQVQMLLEQTKHGRIATVRMIKAPAGSVFIDLLFSSSGIEAEIVAGSEPIEVFENLSVAVASLSGLLALKVLSADPNSRPQDVIDIKNLLAEARSEDLEEAIRLLQLVHERGHNRSKDLLTDFEHYRETLP